MCETGTHKRVAPHERRPRPGESEGERARERTNSRARPSLSSPSQTFALSDVAPRSQIKCIVETRGAAHAEELRAALEAADFPLVWGSSSDASTYPGDGVDDVRP